MTWTIDELPEDRFLAGWRSVVGEAPAAMLDDRRAMIALLVETSPVLALTARTRTDRPSRSRATSDAIARDRQD